MPKKLTIEDVKNFIKQYDVNHDCELLSTEYINLRTPLEFKCNICGNNFFKDFGHIKQRKNFKCQTCSRRSSNSFTIEKVRDYIEKNDKHKLCTLLSTTYVNNSTPLEFKCNKCGEIFFRDYQHLTRGEGRFQCLKCGIHQGASKNVYTEDFVKNAILKTGYQMIGEYKNAATPFKVRCEKGHEFMLIFSYYLNGHSGCKKCANEALKGENHWNWKGGASEIIDYLRKSLKDWKKEVMQRDNYACVLSGQKQDFVIHHLKGFNTIVEEASINVGVPVLKKFNEYENLTDVEKLKAEVLRLHTADLGITLNKDIHILFHRLYGKGNNTPEQFNEFKEKYLNKEL